MHRQYTMASITMLQSIVLVIGFGYPLAFSAFHLPSKANLAKGGCVLFKFNHLQVPRQFTLLAFQTT